MRDRTAVAQPDRTRQDEHAGWPDWARPDLIGAVGLADVFRTAGRPTALAGELYHEWFTPPVVDTCPELLRRPLAGLYRQAHAGSARRSRDLELSVIERRDAIGRDRWWRTWGRTWTPATGRASGARMLLSPRLEAVGELVAAITGALLDSEDAWLLACPTLPSRLRHSGSVVLYLPSDHRGVPALMETLAPMLRADTPPLCLPLAPGVAVAEHPGNGMTFGEHRCHLIALALDGVPRPSDPLRAIAGVFRAHGISPAEPHRRSSLG